MKKTILTIVAIILLATVFGTIDSSRFFANKEPIFILNKTSYSEGGTTFYYGLGYQFIDWHILSYDQKKEKSYYHTKKEMNIFPFLRYGYPEKVDKSDFEIKY